MPLGVLAVFLVGRRLMKSEAEPLLKVSMGYKIENGSIILPNKTPNAQSVALQDGTSGLALVDALLALCRSRAEITFAVVGVTRRESEGASPYSVGCSVVVHCYSKKTVRT